VARHWNRSFARYLDAIKVQAPGEKGEIHFPGQDIKTITLVLEFCPERFTFFPKENKEHNYFEFRLEPWIMEVFFNNFQLKIEKHDLIGKHPLMEGGSLSMRRGNVRVFAKAGNSLIVQPGTNVHLKIWC
jgi:hypothetical protein